MVKITQCVWMGFLGNLSSLYFIIFNGKCWNMDYSMSRHGGVGGWQSSGKKEMLNSKHIILYYQIFWRKMQKFKISWQINQGGLSRDCTVDDTLMVICTTDCTVGDTLWHTWTAGNYWWKIQSIFDTDSRRKLLGNFSWKILIFFSIFHEKFLNNFPLGTLHRLYP